MGRKGGGRYRGGIHVLLGREGRGVADVRRRGLVWRVAG